MRKSKKNKRSNPIKRLKSRPRDVMPKEMQPSQDQGSVSDPNPQSEYSDIQSKLMKIAQNEKLSEKNVLGELSSISRTV